MRIVLERRDVSRVHKMLDVQCRRTNHQVGLRHVALGDVLGMNDLILAIDKSGDKTRAFRPVHLIMMCAEHLDAAIKHENQPYADEGEYCPFALRRWVFDIANLRTACRQQQGKKRNQSRGCAGRNPIPHKSNDVSQTSSGLRGGVAYRLTPL